MKHNFSIMFEQENPFVGAFVLINDVTSSYFWIAVLIMIYIVSSYVFLKKTQDIGKSLLSANHIIVIIAIIIYYWGLTLNVSFLPPVLVLGLIVLEVFSLGILMYKRNET
jgi:uncharacterized membrane protein